VSLPRLVMLVAAGALPLALACGGQGSSPAVDAGALDAGAQALEGGADAANEGDAADDASDAGDADAAVPGPPLPLWSEEAFPEKRTPVPKKADWASAPRVAIDRALPESLFQSREGQSSDCVARRLREWIQIDCRYIGSAILIGGNIDGLSLMGGSSAIFPARRGDRHVIELLETSETVQLHTLEVVAREVSPRIVISEQWIAGDERPSLVVSHKSTWPH
jgi:hypothetical protein